MFLGRRKAIRGKSFCSGLTQAPPRVQPDRLLILVTALLKGDETVKHEIIEGHLGLAFQIVGRYVNARPYLDQDLAAVASLELVRAVDRFPSIAKDKNITGYLVTRVHSALSRYIAEDHIIRIPCNRVRELAKQQRLNNERTIFAFENLDPNTKTMNSDLTNLEVQEFIKSLKMNVGEKQVFDLKRAGFKNVEIAKKLQVSRERIRQRVHSLQVRMLQMMPSEMFARVLPWIGDAFDD